MWAQPGVWALVHVCAHVWMHACMHVPGFSLPNPQPVLNAHEGLVEGNEPGAGSSARSDAWDSGEVW